jgi:hypothetical protein
MKVGTTEEKQDSYLGDIIVGRILCTMNRRANGYPTKMKPESFVLVE